MASLLPTAVDTYKFTKCMKKDEIYDNPKAYKIASKIRTHADEERI